MQKNDNYIKYQFIFNDDKDDLHFSVYFDPENGIALPPKDSHEEEWTKLDYHQCPKCPLTKEKNPNCPIAYNIAGLINKFTELYSNEKVKIIVEVPERTYSKETDIADGLRSIIGIYIAASGCPQTKILKPMATFHLPFASVKESIFRTIGNYFISQYFNKSKDSFDTQLDSLISINKEIDTVNMMMTKRIESFLKADANRNAFSILNSIGMLLEFELQSHLHRLENLYTK